jgi:hypothetical protein
MKSKMNKYKVKYDSCSCGDANKVKQIKEFIQLNKFDPDE